METTEQQTAQPRTRIAVKGILFDMDGTLVDDQPLIDRVWHAALMGFLDKLRPPEGVEPALGWDRSAHPTISPILTYARGRRSEETLEVVLPDLSDRDRRRLRDCVENEIATQLEIDAPAMPGAADFLTALDEAGVPWAVVTSAPSKVAAARMRKAGLPATQHLVGAQDIENGKPAPDPFLAGARALGLGPSDCLVFEDTGPGVESGIAAGSPTVVVGHTPVDQDVPRIADFTAARLEGADQTATGTFTVSVG